MVGGTKKSFSQLVASNTPGVRLRNGRLTSVRNRRRSSSWRFGTPLRRRESDRPWSSVAAGLDDVAEVEHGEISAALTSISG